jgi:anti-sigma B factor antagonist
MVVTRQPFRWTRRTEKEIVSIVLTLSAPEESPAVLSLAGELDLDAAPLVSAALAGLRSSSGQSITVRLDDVAFADCAGLTCLIAAANIVEQAGGRLRVTGATGQVARLLRLCELDWLVAAEANR